MNIKCWLIISVMVLGIFAPVGAQSTADAEVYANLEPITLENADRLVQLPGKLTGVTEGFDVSPDGQQVAVARPDGAYLYDMGSFETPAKIFSVEGAEQVYGPQFSPDGTRLTISTLGMPGDGEITQLWDIQAEKIIHEFVSAPLNGGASFSPDGRFIAGYDTTFYTCQGGCDTASVLWVWTADEIATEFCSIYDCYGRYGVGGFAFTPDSQTLFWSGFDFPGGEIEKGEYYWWAVDLRPYDAEDESQGETFPEIPHGLQDHFDNRTGPFAGDITSIWFSPDGATLVAYNRDDKLSSLWDVETGDLKLSLLAGTRVSGFMPENTILMQDDIQHKAMLLGIDTGRQATLLKNLGENEYISSATPDGRLLVGLEDFETIHFYGVPAESKSTL